MKPSNWEFVTRGLFIALIGALAAFTHPFRLSPPAAALSGILVAACAAWVEIRMRQVNVKALIGGSGGVLIGTGIGLIFAFVLNQSVILQGPTLQFLRLALPLLGAYIGVRLGVAKSELIRPKLVGLTPSDRKLASSPPKVLDTSVLIDGRIADIAESGFLDGRLIVPEFVLHELQMVADSADSSKRNRGRRGLDVVHRLQSMASLKLEVSDQNYPGIREVDLKLIEFGKQYSAKIVTNDFNLNKLAQVQGVKVLNINELANSLKPIVLPGETMRVFISKEGKEYNQGVAYLDDGTMVVVDNARRLISKTIDITVTSVLQTTAGKMIFGKFDDRHGSAGEQRIQAASAGTGLS
ncbi:MAG TPA: PIN domain-containing protein [Bryobacteraceae bacterium]|nr:PIN domain-containing protein [Bryobacteraceae bacterium]